MRLRLLGLGILLAAVGIVLMASPASAHCAYELDRERTVRGGEFYAIGEGFPVGEYIEFRWRSAGGPLLATLVTSTPDFRQRLVTPRDASIGWSMVVALVDPGQNYHDYGNPSEYEYTISRSIEVVDPSAPAPPAASKERPPAPPDHTPAALLPEPVPQAQPARVHVPQEAAAPDPVRAAVRVPAPADAPVPVRQPGAVYEPQREPQVAPVPARHGREALTPVRSWSLGTPRALPLAVPLLLLTAGVLLGRRRAAPATA